MTKALGEDRAQSVLGRITPSSSERPIEILDWMDARAISELIVDEHPQIIALIISYLDAAMGADVLNMLPEELQPLIVERIANLENVQPDAIKELESVMEKKFQANTTLRASQVGGIKAAAAIMNFTTGDTEQAMGWFADSMRLRDVINLVTSIEIPLPDSPDSIDESDEFLDGPTISA